MHNKYKFLLFVTLCLLPLVGSAQASFAVSNINKPNLSVKPVKLKVRTINAMIGGQDQEMEIDSRLRDLHRRFDSLPYKVFNLRSFEQIEVPVKKKEFVKLPDGQTLEFRLIYRDDKKLGLWLDWHDEYGLQLLNSRIHLNCKESFLAGTENQKGGAYFLAIDLEH